MSINQTNANKYLDSAGVSQLWTAIKNADSAVASTKVGYITVEGNTMYLWTDKLAYDTAIADGSNLATAAISTTDVSAFLTDGLLDSVTIVEASETNVIDGSTSGTYIEFKWKDANGDGTADKVSYLEASKIGKVYSEGTGINISDTDNKISVEDAPATEILTTDVIPAAGGPLASYVKTAYPNGIPAGTSIQDILMNLICKEEWPTSTSVTNGAVQVSLAAPSVTLKAGTTDVNNGTVEIGTVCTLSAVSLPSAAVPSVKTYPSVSGFTYGYSTEDDNTKNSSNKSISATVKTGPGLDGTNYTLAIDYTNFKQTDGTTAMADVPASENTSKTYDGISVESTNVVVTTGENKVVYSATGPKATVTFNSIPSYYAVSNLGKTHKDNPDGTTTVFHKSTEVAVQSPTSAVASNSTTLKVTGKYKYFIGYFNDTQFANKTYTSDFIRDTGKAGTLLSSGWMNGKTINYTAEVPAGAYGLYIAIPKGVDDTGASLKVFQPSANIEVQEGMANVKRTIPVTCGGSYSKDYVVFTWVYNPGTAGKEKFNITSF